MNLVEPGTQVKPLAPRILVRAEGGEASEEAFHAASRLREAGYVAELDLGGREPDDLRWLLDVRRKEPSFVLHDEVKSGKAELSTIEEVLKAIQKGDG
jgi:hypothetical protein